MFNNIFHLVISMFFLNFFAPSSTLQAAGSMQKLSLKNISNEKTLYFAVGFELRLPSRGIRGFVFGHQAADPMFLSSQFATLKKLESTEVEIPAGTLESMCLDLENCSYLQGWLNKETLMTLKQKMSESKSSLAELRPVLVVSWNKEQFLGEGEGHELVSNAKELENNGAYILGMREPGAANTHFFDVVEWKNIGSNTQAGFLSTVEKWQKLNEAPYIQVVSYAQEFIPKELSLTSYANYPVYVSVVACEIDITSLHEGRNCSFALGLDGQSTHTWKVEKNEKAVLAFRLDVRAQEYFSSRPKQYNKIATRNPYRVYLIASPFAEDVDQSPKKPSPTISQMRNVLTNSRYQRIASIDALDSGYSNFYIYQNNKGISFFVGDYIATDITNKLFNKLASLASPWSGSVLPVGGSYVDSMLSYIKTSTDQNVAQVIDRSRKATLSNSEQESIQSRKDSILNFIQQSEKKRLTNYVPNNFDIKDIKSDMLPNVSFAASGGGYRAMIATLGIKKSLYKNGVDPLFLYQAGLSGSTWYLSKLLNMANADLSRKAKSSDQPLLNESFYRKLSQDLRERPQHNSALTKFLSFPNFEKEHDLLLAFFAPMLVRWAYLQEISLVDLMGSGLWYNLFRDSDPFDLKLSNFQELMKSGQVPFTLMTSVTKTDAMAKDDYLWFEFSPFEIGATSYQRFVSTKDFSRYFENGKSITVSPELILPFYMGMWGSAMSAGILDGLRQEVVPSSIQLKGQIPLIGDVLEFAQKDFPAISALAAMLTKYELEKSDVREILRYTIKYLDKLAFYEFNADNKININRLKIKLMDSEKKLAALPLLERDFDIDELSWLYEDEVKPIAIAAYSSQPDRVSLISKKLTTAQKISQLQAFSGAIVGNPYYQMDFPGNALKDMPSIELRDGGVDFNIPFPALLSDARSSDIIVAFDASPDVSEKAKALQNGCLYAQRHGIKRFPIQECLDIFSSPQKMKRLIHDVFTVIGNPDLLDTITVIYVPLKTVTSENYEEMKNLLKKDYSKFVNYNPHNDYTGTMNLRYTPEQVDELSGFAEMLGDAVSGAIRDIFQRKFRQKINAH